MWTSRAARGFVWVECDACAHQWVVDVETDTLGDWLPISGDSCPECDSPFDLDLFSADVVEVRY